MILIASDVASLSQSLGWWELGEYVSGVVVALACAGEYIADFTNCFTGGDRKRKAKLGKGATLLLVVALVAELMCLVKTNSLSGQIIGSLNEKATGAFKASTNALSAAAIASDTANGAATVSGGAKSASASAVKTAGDVETLARGVRRDANSLKTEISQLSHQTSDIRDQIAWRDLTPAQQGRVTSSVCKFGGIDVLISLHAFGGEASNLRNKIRTALPQTCGFVISGRAPSNETEPFSGIQVILQPDDADPRHKAFATALVDALTREGLAAVGPIPPPDRGATAPGPTAYKAVVTEGASPIPGFRVEIAIGDKP